MRRSIRVLHLLPDMQLGGGQILLLRNIEALRRVGVESVVCSVWRDTGVTMTPRFEAAGIPVMNLNLRRSLLPVAVGRLLREVRRHRIDLIHTNNTWWDRRFGAIAGRACRVPVVNSFHSMLFDRRAELVEIFDELHLRRAFSAGIAVSSAVLDVWRPTIERLGIPHDRMRVIRPGLELSSYASGGPDARARTRASLGLDADAPVLIDVARLVEGKGHLELLETMVHVVREQPNARLLIVGEGHLRRPIEARLHHLGLDAHVHLLGQRDDIAELMEASDLFVFTSGGEGFGIVLAEAIASGLPVAAFALPVLTEIIGAGPDAAGVSVEQGDTAGLAREIVALLEDGPRRMELSGLARARALSTCSSLRAAQAIADLYAEVLEAWERDPGVAIAAERQVARG
jgi:glycosyltransferase involved in cell wall biosynthesis